MYVYILDKPIGMTNITLELSGGVSVRVKCIRNSNVRDRQGLGVSRSVSVSVSDVSRVSHTR